MYLTCLVSISNILCNFLLDFFDKINLTNTLALLWICCAKLSKK